MGRLLFSVSLVVFGIGVGYSIQVLVRKGIFSLPIDDTRKKLQKAALLFFNPVAILGATWVADIHDVKIAALPFMGFIALFSGGCLAYAASRIQHLNRKQTGAYIVCGGFTNIGSLGGLFCFMFFGEQGFALVPFYKLFEEALYYAVGFPIAKAYSNDVSETPSFFQRLKNAVSDIFVLVAISSIAAGLLLNVVGVSRPSIYATINTIFVPLAALLLLISIGMAMRFSSVKTHFGSGLSIAFIKILFVPVLVVGLSFMIGLDQISNGLPLKVVLILASMPVGFIAMVPPTIYDLDIDLANACWLISNSFLLFQVPLLLYLINLI